MKSIMIYGKLAIRVAVKKARKTDGRKASLMESRLASSPEGRNE
jgi:hypothetical protein